MVAYSFAPQFTVAVAMLEKTQTVRGHRKRHARPGEALQLFTGMRTRHCRKLLTPDPVCVDVRPIAIAQAADGGVIIDLEGRILDAAETENFAIADGFGFGGDGRARFRMAEFWLRHHGPGAFGGVVIRWQPA